MRFLILLIALSCNLIAPAHAADDVAAAQGIIRSQDRAIGRDDAATAYSFAGPPITSMYRDAGVFMYMVRHGYPPVYRHQSFEFGETKTLGGKITQQVHIIDADGIAWEALYTLERQTDGSIKIVSCVLSKAVGA